MSSTTASKAEQSPASIYAGSEPQTPDDGAILTAVAQLSIADDHSIEVKTDESGSYSMDTKAEKKGFSPATQRYSPPFVRNGLRSQSEDPFKSSSPITVRRHAGSLTPTAANSSRKASIMNKDWRSGSGSSDDDDDDDESSVTLSPSHARSQVRSTARKLSFSIENGSELRYSLVKPDDAQGIYPPSCCVFVANLLQSESEETLQMAVTQVFREFGPVFVKIRRDSKQMPFAFCQYTKSAHADRAIKEGRGRLIKGRPCRCEKAKAHRLFFVERKFGPTVTPDEVRSLLEPFGSIDFCYTASIVERNALNLNEGVIIQFQLYDDGQNAQSAFRNNDQWKLVAINGMHSPSRVMGPVRSSPVAVDSARAYISRYETDRRSIFVGNLPVGITEEQIREIFEPYGAIEEIILRESVSKFEPQEKFCFAFVEFHQVSAVSDVLAAQGNIMLAGKTLRISQKDSENGGPRRSGRTFSPAGTTASSMYQSPAHGLAHQQASPMSQMAPQVYGSPFGYAYGSPYYYPPGSMYSDGQHYYHPSVYGGYHSYPGSPTYDTTSAATAQAPAASPSAQPWYSYGYGYQYTPAPYWGMSTQQPYSAPAAYSSYSPTIAASTAADDRSATPTPAGNGAAVTEDSFESH